MGQENNNNRKGKWLREQLNPDIPEEMMDDKEKVLEFLRDRKRRRPDGFLSYLSERLRNDPMVVLTALNGHFPYMAPEPGLYLEFSITYPVDFYQHMGGKLRRDEDFAKIICSGFF